MRISAPTTESTPAIKRSNRVEGLTQLFHCVLPLASCILYGPTWIVSSMTRLSWVSLSAERTISRWSDGKS